MLMEWKFEGAIERATFDLTNGWWVLQCPCQVGLASHNWPISPSREIPGRDSLRLARNFGAIRSC